MKSKCSSKIAFLQICNICVRMKDINSFSSFREASLPGWTAGQNGDVPLFHHVDAEVSSSVPSRNCPNCDSQTRHDLTAQALLHLCDPQATETSLLWTLLVTCRQASIYYGLFSHYVLHYFAQQCSCVMQVYKKYMTLECSFYTLHLQRIFRGKPSSTSEYVIHFIQLLLIKKKKKTEQHACLHNTFFKQLATQQVIKGHPGNTSGLLI